MRRWSLVALVLAACGPLPSSPDADDGAAGERSIEPRETSSEDSSDAENTSETPSEDAAVVDDAQSPDTANLDAASADTALDEAPDTVSIDSPAMDAPRTDGPAPDRTDSAPSDAPAPTDAGGMCAINSVPGACVDTAICTSGQVTASGLCPGAANIRCCAPPNDTWCPTNGFPLPNESLTEEPGQNGCRAGMLRVDTFCVDRFEASLVVVRADGSTVGWSPYWHPSAGQRYRAVSLRGAVPQGNISGTQAAAACAEAGKRLCTNTEWLRACQGSARTTYPYGNTRRPGVCNDARATHPAVQCFRSSASFIWSNLGYPGISQQADSLDRTGANPGCVTAEGALDMMGNLHEWTSDPAGTFRGGFYVDTTINGNGCLYATTAHDVSHWDYSTGFRCCADPG